MQLRTQQIQNFSDIQSATDKYNTTCSRMWNLPQPECRNYHNHGNNFKSVSLQSREEMISLHNMQSDSTAVALITKSIQQGALGSLSLDKGGVGGWTHLSPKLNILQLPWCVPSYILSPPHLSECLLLSLYLLSMNPHHGLSRPAQDKFCLHWDGGGERRAWTKDTFIAVGSGWLRTDNGHILQFLKQIAVCSLPN